MAATEMECCMFPGAGERNGLTYPSDDYLLSFAIDVERHISG